METSRPDPPYQRPRDRCEPGQRDRPKILPEPQTERPSTSDQNNGFQPDWIAGPDH